MRAYRSGGRAAIRRYLTANGEAEPLETEEAEGLIKARALARTTGISVQEAEERIEEAERKRGK